MKHVIIAYRKMRLLMKKVPFESTDIIIIEFILLKELPLSTSSVLGNDFQRTVVLWFMRAK